jgi:hypothetical protein
MTQEADVNNCFDSAFFQVVREHPDPNKSMSDDYSLPPPQVQRILFLTSSCLSSKGYIFTSSQALVDKCATETVLAVLQDINANTKRKAKLPLVAAQLSSARKPKTGPKPAARKKRMG